MTKPLPTTKASRDITRSCRSRHGSWGYLSSGFTISALMRTPKAGDFTQSNSAKTSASTKTQSLTTAASPQSSFGRYVWWSIPESTRKDGHATKSSSSSASPARLMSPRFSLKPTATSHGPRKLSVTSWASSSSASSGIARRENWVLSSIFVLFTMRCSTAEPFPSISSTSEQTNGSRNKNQSDRYWKWCRKKFKRTIVIKSSWLSVQNGSKPFRSHQSADSLTG